MWKSILRKIWLFWLLCIWLYSFSFTNAAWDDEIEWYTILPEIKEKNLSELNTKINDIWTSWGHVMENYRKVAEESTVEEQLATGIMNRDTLINYLVYIVKFLSQLWLAVWAVFIIIAWYKYMISVFNWWKADSNTVKNAIIWVIIVIFSYAIMKFFTSIFLWS